MLTSNMRLQMEQYVKFGGRGSGDTDSHTFNVGLLTTSTTTTTSNTVTTTTLPKTSPPTPTVPTTVPTTSQDPEPSTEAGTEVTEIPSTPTVTNLMEPQDVEDSTDKDEDDIQQRIGGNDIHTETETVIEPRELVQLDDEVSPWVGREIILYESHLRTNPAAPWLVSSAELWLEFWQLEDSWPGSWSGGKGEVELRRSP